MYTFNFLEKWATEKPDDLAFADGAVEVTYSQLNSQVRKTATFLGQKGISRGDVVCTVLAPHESLVFTLALQLLGVTTLSKNLIAPFEINQIPTWMISYKPHPQVALSQTILLDQSVFAGIASCLEISRGPGYKNLSDIARIFSTSGTTGISKSISVTIEELATFTDQVSSYDLVGELDAISLSPFAARQSYRRALKCLTRGTPFYSARLIDIHLIKMLGQYPIRTMIGSSAQISNFLELQSKSGSKFPNLGTIIMGGSVPTPEIINRIKKQLNCKIYDAYGSSEGSYVAMREVSGGSGEGLLLNPDINLQIVDELDRPLPHGSTGRIRYTRPGIANSYVANPEATKETFKDGFFYPGDLGCINGNGELLLKGRSSDVINIGGVKFNPESIEKIAINQLGVLDCATFPLTSALGADELAILLVVNEDFDEETFSKVMGQKSPMAPKIVFQAASIPRNENGKILRGDLSRSYGAR